MNDIIRWHNNFIEAVYKLKLIPKKLLIGIAYKVQQGALEDDKLTLSVSEICSIVGITKDSYKYLSDSLDILMKTVITIKDRYNEKNYIKFQLLGESMYKNGVLTANIPKSLQVFLMELTDKYTKYKLNNIKPLTSEYSIRIFELLKENAYRGNFSLELNELKIKLGIQDKYTQFGHLKSKVIDVAYKELLEKCDTFFEYELIKKGKKVYKIKFFIKNIENVETRDIDLNLDERSLLEHKLKQYGWIGDFDKLCDEIGYEAVEYYFTTILLKNIIKLDIEDRHEYIDNNITANALSHYHNYLKTLSDNSSDYIEYELAVIGYTGDIKKLKKRYTEEQINEALKYVKTIPHDKISNLGGLFITYLKSIEKKAVIIKEETKKNEIKKELKKNEIKIKINLSKIELEKIYNTRVEQGIVVNINDAFKMDWENFKSLPEHELTCLNDGTRTIDYLNSLNCSKLDDLCSEDLYMFLKWKGFEF